MKVYIVSSRVGKDCYDDNGVVSVFGSEKLAKQFVEQENNKKEYDGYYYYEEFVVCCGRRNKEVI